MRVGDALFQQEPATVLLVDDHPADRLALRAILEPLEIELIEASSGDEALRLIERHNLAAVLLDVQMPGQDGYQTAKRIRETAARRLPILFLTAYESDRFPLIEAYRLGAVDYLVKPLIREIVQAKVAMFVELFRHAERIRQQAKLIEDTERTERIRLAAALKESDERHRVWVNAVKEFAIFLLDTEGRITSWNEGGERLTDPPAPTSERPTSLEPSEVRRSIALAGAVHQRLNGLPVEVRADFINDQGIHLIRTEVFSPMAPWLPISTFFLDDHGAIVRESHSNSNLTSVLSMRNTQNNLRAAEQPPASPTSSGPDSRRTELAVPPALSRQNIITGLKRLSSNEIFIRLLRPAFYDQRVVDQLAGVTHVAQDSLLQLLRTGLPVTDTSITELVTALSNLVQRVSSASVGLAAQLFAELQDRLRDSGLGYRFAEALPLRLVTSSSF